MSDSLWWRNKWLHITTSFSYGPNYTNSKWLLKWLFLWDYTFYKWGYFSDLCMYIYIVIYIYIYVTGISGHNCLCFSGHRHLSVSKAHDQRAPWQGYPRASLFGKIMIRRHWTLVYPMFRPIHTRHLMAHFASCQPKDLIEKRAWHGIAERNFAAKPKDIM